MFSGRHELYKVKDAVFLDRNPEIFRLLLDLLRDKEDFPRIFDESKLLQLQQELNFWGLDNTSLSQNLEAVSSLKFIFNSVPNLPQYIVNDMWRSQGAFDIEKYYREGKVKINSLRIIKINVVKGHAEYVQG